MPRSPSGASARPSPHVLIKSLELSALHTSQIRDMVRLNGNRSSATCGHRACRSKQRKRPPTEAASSIRSYEKRGRRRTSLCRSKSSCPTLFGKDEGHQRNGRVQNLFLTQKANSAAGRQNRPTPNRLHCESGRDPPTKMSHRLLHRARLRVETSAQPQRDSAAGGGGPPPRRCHIGSYIVRGCGSKQARTKPSIEAA